MRELENEIERALVLAAADGVVDVGLLSAKLCGPRAAQLAAAAASCATSSPRWSAT